MATKAKTTAKPRGKAFVKDDPRINKDGAPVMEHRLSTWIEKALLELQEEKGYENKVTKAQILGSKIVARAMKEGDDFMTVVKEIADRTEGKPQQKVDHTSGGEKLQVIPILGGLTDQELSTDD